MENVIKSEKLATSTYKVTNTVSGKTETVYKRGNKDWTTGDGGFVSFSTKKSLIKTLFN
jgi:hypothetical protein